MTLYKLVQDVCNLGKSSPNVNFVTQGDIYQLNHNQDIDYPAFVVTQGTHTGSDYDEEQFTLTLFAVDRLVSDKSNEIDVQSWANGVLMDVIRKIEEFYIGTVQPGFKIQTFTEKFDSLCAGAYATIAVTIENMDCDCSSKSIGFVTSVNGQTGDVTIKGYEGSVVSSVNGQTGDVYLNIPQKVSDLRNDVPYASESYVNNKIKDVSTYVSNTYIKKGDVPIVPTDYVHIEDFNKYVQVQTIIDESQNSAIEGKQDQLVSGQTIKTINGQSLLGSGNIHIEGGGGGSDTDHVNITKEEYDNLPEEEKMSDTVYFITDIKYVKHEDYVDLIDTHIKTINGEDIRGEGNIEIKGRGSDTEHINITEAEYNELPIEEKMSDKVYFITDIQYVRYSDYLALEERVRALEEKLQNNA